VIALFYAVHFDSTEFHYL